MKPPIPMELKAETLAYAIRYGIASNDPTEAVRWINEYAKQQVKKISFNPSVSGSVCDHKNKRNSEYFSDWFYCPDCNTLIRKQTDR